MSQINSIHLYGTVVVGTLKLESEDLGFFCFCFLIYILFIFGYVGSSSLHAGFLQLRRAEATLHCSAWASHCSGFSCCGVWALGMWASVVVAHGLSSCGFWALERRLSSCGAQAQLLCSMWDLPGPWLEPVSPALAGRFLTTAPPGKSRRPGWFVFLLVFLKIYLFMAVLGLHFCVRAFSSCGKQGPLFIVVCGPLTIAASLVEEHRLQTLRLSNYGSWAQLLHGMQDPPRPGLEPVSPALAGRLSTTAPPGKPRRPGF